MYKIMIVDDESIERDALKYIIKQSELEINEIEEACSGREAIEKAMLFKPDIMLIDIKMPGINGIEAVKRIKQIFPDLQVLFLTAFNYFNYAQEAIKVGAKEFVVKPATNDQIIQALEGIINNLKKDQERKFREREAKTRLEQVTNYFESELVALLSIAGNDISQAEEYLNILGLRMEKAVAIVAEINYSAGEIPVVSALQKGMIKKRCMVKLKAEFEKENIKTLVCTVGEYIYMIVFLNNREDLHDQDNIARLVGRINEQLHMQLNVPLKAGVGNYCNALDDICASFTRAKIALHKIKTPYGVNCYSHLTRQDTKQQYPVMKEQELYRKIISGDEREVSIIINELIEWIQNNHSSTEEMCRKVFEMMVFLKRSLSMETKLSFSTVDDFMENILEMKSAEMLRGYSYEIIKQMMNELRSSMSSRTVLLVNKACEYVRENFTRDLTLEDAAAVAGISQYYLSKVFKQVKQMNFVDYLSMVRIKKAKELLKNPSLSINEVSSMVGYSDANYFSRVFKKIEKISPSDYRTRL
jgi:two-component system response regulator YesN